MSRRYTFSDLVGVFINQALIALGAVPDPITKQSRQDLDAAQAAIEFLEIIEERTRATRSEEEEQLLLQALTTLRLQYVQAFQTANPASSAPSQEQRA
ncbi:MAG: DUF1844 domain-containing protein [Bacteroidota bacterium]|nr:DUF1844 domain-containing protein [Bacteroidota bacterium]MDW8271863.1 DUF1844 domain-containing protein [Bacteroidota bacterium]